MKQTTFYLCMDSWGENQESLRDPETKKLSTIGSLLIQMIADRDSLNNKKSPADIPGFLNKRFVIWPKDSMTKIETNLVKNIRVIDQNPGLLPADKLRLIRMLVEKKGCRLEVIQHNRTVKYLSSPATIRTQIKSRRK